MGENHIKYKNTQIEAASNSQKAGEMSSSQLPGCYMLIILGEPLYENHIEKIIDKVARGEFTFFFFFISSNAA